LPDLNGPWADDIRTAFEDEGLQAQVDGFLREKIQPYVTQLEQQRGPKEALELYNDLREQPGETWFSLTAELFGEDAAAELASTLRAEEAEEEPVAQEPGNGLSPEDAQLLAELRNQKQVNAYQTAKAEFIAQHDDVKENLFDPFVAAAEGDFEQAYAAYTKYVEDFKAAFGVAPPNADPAAPAPPVMDQSTQAPPAPPVAKQYGRDLNSAIDDMFGDLTGGAPPAIGSV
jgi:hypothetical protein